MNDRFVIKRGWNQVCMFIVTIAAILLLCAKQQILLDQILGIVCVAMIWFVLFLFFIEHDRAEGLISHNRETDFKKVLYSYTAAAVVVVFASYFPEFVKSCWYLYRSLLQPLFPNVLRLSPVFSGIP